MIHVAKLTLGIEVCNPTLKRPSPERASRTRLRRKRSSARHDRSAGGDPLRRLPGPNNSEASAPSARRLIYPEARIGWLPTTKPIDSKLAASHPKLLFFAGSRERLSNELRTARFARLLGRPDRTLSAPFPSGTRPAFLTIRAALQFLCICLIVWTAGVSEASSATRHVVLLFDERPELPGLAMLEAEFTRTLASNSADRVEIYREELDLSRFGSLTYQARLPDLLKTKYADKKIDAVVAVLGPSLEFLLNYGAEIFPGVPIVFCGIDRRELNDRPLPSNVRGILVKRQFDPTLEIALKIHPGTERVVVVAGTSEFDTRLLNQAREEFRAYENRVAFTYLTTLSLPNLLTEVSRLPPRTIVLFTTLFQDGAGESFVTHDVAERISATANAPVYGFLDQYVGRGIVGGSLYSLAAQGAEAAKLVAQILTGAKSSEPTLLEVPANLLLFDWRQLQRWGISKASLPANSEIRFRNRTLWDQYRWHLLIGLTVLLVDTI